MGTAPLSEVNDQNIRYLRPDLADFLSYNSPDEYYFDNDLETQAEEAAESYRYEKQLESLANDLISSEDFIESRELAREMGEKIDRSLINREDLAMNVKNCFRSGKVMMHEHGNNWFPYVSCGGWSKLCPFHARSETKRRLMRYLPHVEQAKEQYRMQFVTLTVPNCDEGELQEAVDELFEAWQKLRRRNCWDDPAVGMMVNVEVTWNSETEQFHPHLHVLVALEEYDPEDPATDFDWSAIGQAWEELTGGAIQPEFSPDLEGQAVKEVTKYPCKLKARGEKEDGTGGGLLDMTDTAFAEWFVVFKGMRTMRTYGIWFRCATAECFECGWEGSENSLDRDDQYLRCPECGEVVKDLSSRLGDLIAEVSFKFRAGQPIVEFIQGHNSTAKVAQYLTERGFRLPGRAHIHDPPPKIGGAVG